MTCKNLQRLLSKTRVSHGETFKFITTCFIQEVSATLPLRLLLHTAQRTLLGVTAPTEATNSVLYNKLLSAPFAYRSFLRSKPGAGSSTVTTTPSLRSEQPRLALIVKTTGSKRLWFPVPGCVRKHKRIKEIRKNLKAALNKLPFYLKGAWGNLTPRH